MLTVRFAMTTYVAFLRSINVGGRAVKMDRLRQLFESLGFSNVKTFIASGNVVFESASRNAKTLKQKIEAKLREAVGCARRGNSVRGACVYTARFR